MTFDNFLDAAIQWHRFGFNVIPIGPNSKKTVVKWDDWLNNLREEKFRDFWDNHPYHEIGHICDERLLVLDADTPESAAKLHEIEKVFDVKPALIIGTTNGFHHYFKRAEETFAHMDSHSSGKNPERIDIRTGKGNGNGMSMAVLPPSKGKEIVLLEADSIDDLTVVSQDFIDAIWRHNGKEPPRAMPVPKVPTAKAEPTGDDARYVQGLLKPISSECGYQDWLYILMGTKHTLGDTEEAFAIVEAWSSTASNYCGTEKLRRQWDAIKLDVPNPITIGTLIKKARENGADIDKLRGDAVEQFERLDKPTEVIYPKVESVGPGTGTKVPDFSVVSNSHVVTADKRNQSVIEPGGQEVDRSNLEPIFNYQALDIGNFKDLRITRDGPKPLATLANTEILLDLYSIKAQYNVITKKVDLVIPDLKASPTNIANTAMSVLISLANLHHMPANQVPAYVAAIADQHQKNPVMDWIQSKPWDGVDRLPEFYDTLAIHDDFPVEMRNLLMRRWLISAVAAASMASGFRSRGVLTLQGRQSIGKTAWVLSLVPDPLLRDTVLLVDHLLDPSNKDSKIEAVSHWIVELGELDSSIKRDVSRLKGFLTAPMDKVRVPYAKAASEFSRKTVFIATVNENEFLLDPTGNTRFWTLPVTSVNFQHGLDMQQIFSQVEHLYRVDKEQWWLTQEEELQLEDLNKSHRAVSVIREAIESELDFDAPESEWDRKTASEVLHMIGNENPTNPQARECGQVLRERLGDPKRSQGVNRWLVPPRNGWDERRYR